MSNKIDVGNLTGVMETLLPVLYSRVYETRQASPILQDPVAEAWIARIDYDFSQYETSVLNNLGVAIRTVILDDYTNQFIAQYPQATIINIAAGLDTRFYRMDNGKITWIELDLPDSIAVRQQLMDETERHRTLAASALDTDWMDDLASTNPTLFIVEGLLMYLTEEQIKGMLGAIAERFPHAEFLLEVLGKTQATRTHLNDAISKTAAQFKFGIRDASQMANWHPNLSYIGDTSYYDLHQERWLALDIDWHGKPISAYRNSTGRIVQLRVED
ncbi:MAG: class I SAM-dependent methyltransferase [Phototrophicaceae bacterium]